MVDKALLDREMWSLSKDEAEAVRKRVDTLTTATLKKRKQQRADVRKVFAGQTQVDWLYCMSLCHDGQKQFQREEMSQFVVVMDLGHHSVPCAG